MPTRKMRFFWTFIRLLLIGAGLNAYLGCKPAPQRTSQDWIYPGAEFVENEAVENVPGATKVHYRTNDDPEVVQDYYLRRFAEPDWQLNALQTNRIIRDGVHNGGMSGLSTDQKQFIRINILRDQTPDTQIWITQVPDLAAVREAHATPAQVIEQSSSGSPTSTPPSEAKTKWPPSLDLIARLINERDADGLHAMGFDEFQRQNPVRFLRTELERLHIESTQSRLTAIDNDDVCMTVFDYEMTSDDDWSRGTRVMFWSIETGTWRFHNLPFLRTDGVLPSVIVNAFRQKED